MLAGQPELEQKLNLRELRQLRQRIAMRAQTLPLTPEETRRYILERLRIAGSNGEEIFTPEAIEAIHLHAHGIPRVTNLLSEHALMRAFDQQLKPIPAEVVEAVARAFCVDESVTAESPVPVESSKKRRTRNQSARSRVRRPNPDLNSEMGQNSEADQRSVGIRQGKLPLFVYGYAADGTPFYEETDAIATNSRGGLISMRTPVEPGQRLLITNKENESSQECVVEFLGARLKRGVDVAFGFTMPGSEFWDAKQETDGSLIREHLLGSREQFAERNRAGKCRIRSIKCGAGFHHATRLGRIGGFETYV